MVDEDGCKGSWEAAINIGSCIFFFHLCCTKMRCTAGNWSQVREKSGNFEMENEWQPCILFVI